MEKRDVVIIGGGASGLFLSTLLPQSLLLERNDRVGIKLLLTGGGKCNFTHQESERELITHYYDKKNFVSPSLYSFGPEKIIKYFQSLGLESYTRGDGKVFPIGNSADVISCLLNHAGEIGLNTRVVSIEKEEDSFILKTNNGEIKCAYLVIATGGKSYPKTGSDGSSYALSSMLGHTIIPPVPALSSILLEEDVSKIEGITIEDCSIKIGKYDNRGSLLFTKNGISGPMVQNLSRYASSPLDIILSLSSFKPEEIKTLNGSKKAIKEIHEITVLPLRLLEERLDWKDKKIGDLNKKDIAQYRDRIYSWKTKGSTKNQFNTAMVTRGGVDTSEVDSKTLMSKKCPNLWIVGEALDVDGECGGYNLSFAFASAFLAASSIKTLLQ